MIQIWQHTKSGELYAVQFDDDIPVAACGPLHWREIPAAMESFDNDWETLDYLISTQNEYSDVTTWQQMCIDIGLYK